MTQFDKGPVTISIIMPAYNVEQYIAEAIESVLRQPTQPCELIIVNDGSTDNTRKVIAGYECNAVIRVVDQPNQGPGPARNNGIALATGDYFYCMDADDWLAGDLVGFVQRVVSEQAAPDLVLFSGITAVDDSCSHHYRPDYQRQMLGLLHPEDFPASRLYDAGSFFCSPCLYAVRRGFWQDEGFSYKPILHEDEELIFPLISLAQSLYVSDRVLFHRRVREGSIMTTRLGPRNVAGCQAVFDSLLEFRRQHCHEVFFDEGVCQLRLYHFFRQTMYWSRDAGVSGSFLRGLAMISKARMLVLLPVLFKSHVSPRLKSRLMRMMHRQ